MIYGHIDETDQWKFLTANTAWRHAFEWLQALPTEPETGRYELMGDDMYAMVMRYDTVGPDETKYESHRKYVDLQYTIQGGELIGWCRSSSLAAEGEFDAGKDLQFYQPAEPVTLLGMDPGQFAIFFPSDAHQPKLSDGLHTDVFKAVVKVAVHLVS